MKKIYDYVAAVNEGRTPGAKNKPKDNLVMPGDEGPDMNDVAGEDPEDNGSAGLYSIDFFDDTEPAPLEKDKLNKNMKRLLMKFKSEEDFFVIGEAGWGKTSIIEDMAHRFKRHVVTVYLDKAVATDLGGIPVPVKGRSGAVQEMAMPAWAKVMEDHPNDKFLLFFDEMNQAQPDVMNALMPIVLKHEVCGRKFGPKVKTGKKDKFGRDIYTVKESNFFVGAAGNFEHENDAVSELSGPLRSRFKPLIEWETGTPEGWAQAFEYMRKKWGKDDATNELISTLEDASDLFVNPREVEMKIIQHAVKLKQNNDDDLFDASDYLDRLEGLSKNDLTRTQQAQLSEIADALYSFVSGTAEKKTGRSATKDINMVPENIINAIKSGMKLGYILQGGVKYGIARENIFDIEELDPEVINREMLERIVSKLEADGNKFKFEKSAQWKKAGYKDPNED